MSNKLKLTHIRHLLFIKYSFSEIFDSYISILSKNISYNLLNLINEMDKFPEKERKKTMKTYKRSSTSLTYNIQYENIDLFNNDKRNTCNIEIYVDLFSIFKWKCNVCEEEYLMKNIVTEKEIININTRQSSNVTLNNYNNLSFVNEKLKSKSYLIKFKCNHFTCNDCFAEYINEFSKEYQVKTLKCPFSSCQRRFKVNEDYSLLKVFMNQLILKKIYSIEYKSIVKSCLSINNHKTLLDCTYPDCLSYGISNSESYSSKIYCLKGHCLVNNKNDNMIKEENSFFQLLDKHPYLYKSCPKCGIWIEKLKGCNHIICSYCKYEWCWICSRIFKINHYSDISSECFNKMYEGNGNYEDDQEIHIMNEIMRYNNRLEIINVDDIVIVSNVSNMNRNINENTNLNMSRKYKLGRWLFEFTIDYKNYLYERLILGILLFVFMMISSFPNYILIKNIRKRQMKTSYSHDYSSQRQFNQQRNWVDFGNGLINKLEIIFYIAFMLCAYNIGIYICVFYYFPLILYYIFKRDG